MFDRIFWLLNSRGPKWEIVPYIGILLSGFMVGFLSFFLVFAWIGVVEYPQILGIVLTITIFTFLLLVFTIWWDYRMGQIKAINNQYLKKREEVGLRLGKIKGKNE